MKLGFYLFTIYVGLWGIGGYMVYHAVIVSQELLKP